MRLARWIIIVTAITVAGWMAYDGTRALIVGDYVTPSSGQYAGQLGPWKHVVSAVGIEPRSTLMKSLFAIYGFAWLVTIGCFAVRFRWTWTAMLVFAFGSLWYVPFGTLLGIVQIVLLWLPGIRGTIVQDELATE